MSEEPPTKRRRGEGNKVITREELDEVLSKAIKSYDTASLALLYILNEYDFSLSSLQEVLLEKGLDVSFSSLKYDDIAPFVGLDPFRFLKDIGTFELHRSRIPTKLLQSILIDMDVMLKQYGPLSAHETEEATSRFLSPIFHHLIAEFGFAFRNSPESIIEGRVTRRGKIEYYLRAFGSVSALIIELKLKVGNDKERLDAIAQVIAELDACDWKNSTGKFFVPVFGILWDGTYFQFFMFVGSSKIPHSFLRGAFTGDPANLRNGLMLPHLTPNESTLPFIRSLRRISETIFGLLLCAYISSIEAFRDRSVRTSKDAGTRRQSSGEWGDAVIHAKKALEQFRDAEKGRQKKDTVGANQAVSDAKASLEQSIAAVPILDDTNILIMTNWDEDDIELA